ncbi:ATP-binding protein [Vibrio sp. Of7-15]|uniref:PAS domain-containing sensor histidine kinase n=1 Tax=Vibrio sp. Of7-15 TaxID=2724879 RepID=UPI001EF2887F|nr:ATP-binding protein [Vibrio sp. Of7-15]MCG7496260.1 ATP-binding protein [Vibrio sp. Of7-15]
MKKISLQSFLIIIFFCTTFFTVTLIGSGILVGRLPQVAYEASENAKIRARNIAQLFVNSLQDANQDITILSKLINEVPQRHWDAMIDTFLSDDVNFSAIYISDLEGNILSVKRDGSNEVKIEGRDLSLSPLFMEAFDSLSVVWSDKYLSPVTYQNTVGVALNHGSYIVFGEIDHKHLRQLSHSWIEYIDSPILVIDSRGQWIIDNDNNPNNRVQNWGTTETVRFAELNDGNTRETTLFDQNIYPSSAVIEGVDWRVITGEPASLENERYAMTVFLVVIAYVASCMLAVGMAPFWAKILRKQLDQIMLHTHKVASGGTTGKWPKSKISELTQLSNDIENMAASLIHRELELSENKKKAEAVFDMSPSPMMVARHLGDEQFKIEAVNQSWLKQFGINKEQILIYEGTGAMLWCSDDDRTRALTTLLEANRISHFFVWMHGAANQDFLCELSASVMELNGNKYMIFAYDDVTDNYQMQFQLTEFNRNLEHLVEQRTTALKATNIELNQTLDDLHHTRDELVQAEKLSALGGMVAGVAHELNTPIGNGVMAASTLQAQIKSFNQEVKTGLRKSVLDQFLLQASEGTEIVSRNMARADKLIKSFKQLAVDRTSSQYRDFYLQKVVDEILVVMKPMLRNTLVDINVQISDDIKLSSYPGPLGQVLTNLIQNALKHAFIEKQAFKVIEIKAEVDLEQHVSITVKDNGSGITQQNLHKIFEPFYTTQLGKGGSGLGLHIVHNIVTGTLGGTIQVTSQTGEGVTFHIRLPIAVSEQTA